jgi:methyl-accepting chemotaxis protein WspA
MRRSMTIESKLLGLLTLSAAVMGLGAVITWQGMSNPYAEVNKQLAQNDNLFQNLDQQFQHNQEEISEYRRQSEVLLRALLNNPNSFDPDRLDRLQDKISEIEKQH